jgi:tyrosine-protein kinase Etk/Wzc
MTDNIRNRSTDNRNEEIDLGRLFGTLIDNRWLIIAITALFSVSSIIYVLFSTPIYQADALVQVEQNAGNSILNNLSEMLPNSQPMSSTEIELVKSRLVTGKTVDDLDLETVIEQKYSPFFGRGWARLSNQAPAQIALSRFTVPDYMLGQPLELTVINDKEYTLSFDGTEVLKGQVGQFAQAHGVTLLVSSFLGKPGIVFTATRVPKLSAINSLLKSLVVEDKGKDTGVLALSFTGEDPVAVRKTLDSITRNYLLQNVERKSEEAGKSLQFLEKQLPDVRNSLDAAESKLNQFRQANDSVDLSLEAKSVLDTIVSVESQLNELTFKEAEISKLYTKEHPAYRALMEKRQTLENEKAKLNKRVSGMPKTQQEILKLTRDVQAGQEIYMQLLNKQQELSITKASTVGNVRIVDSAVTQLHPVAPKKTLIVLLVTIIGLIVSSALVLLKNMLHRGVENSEELEERGINVYASIPLSEWQQKSDRETLLRAGKKRNMRSESLLAIGNPADLAIEAIRSLRTSLHFAMLESKNNILMISGASPNIGKTFVSINLAAVIAQSGQRILVIDADMRKGYSHALLNTNWNNGLSDILSGQATIEQAVRKTDVENMDFIPRGQIPPNPSELLMNDRCNGLMTWASENYDIVLIDTPPVLAVTDASIIGRMAGTVLMVARFGVNTAKEIEISINRFQQNGIDTRGVILNAIEKRASSYYGGYGYYNYSYKNNN